MIPCPATLPAMLTFLASFAGAADSPSSPSGIAAKPACFCKPAPITVYSVLPPCPSCLPGLSQPVPLPIPYSAGPALLPGTPAPFAAGQTPATEIPDVGELPTPTVAIQVFVPAQVTGGQELEYRIVVENRSRAAAHHVAVRDRVPANARYVRANPEPATTQPELEWRLGTLEAGARTEMRLTLQPLGAGEIDNCVRVAFEHGVRLKTRVTRPTLSLRKQGPTEALLYDALSYQLTVANTGDSAATNVTLVDTLPDGLEHRENKKQLTFSIGNLGPGESRNFSYEVIAKAAGRLCNRAVVTADGGLRDEVEACVVVSEPKLAVTKTAPKRQSFTRSIPYQLTVTNNGTAPLHGVVLIDRLPTQTAFVSASDGGRLAGTQVEWAVGVLAAGASKKVELKLRPLQAGEVVNQAEARADRGLRATAEARTEIVGAPGLLLEVVDLEDPIEVGSDTQYNIIIRNQGTVPATNIRVTATVPEAMAVSKVQGATDHRKDGQKIIFEPLNLPPGKDTVYRIFVRGLKPADVRFRVELTSDQLTAGPLLEEESTNIYSANGGALPPSTKPED